MFVTNNNAQKLDCSSKIKEYQILLKTQDIPKSLEIWKDALKECPKQSEVLYTDGLQLLQYKIDNATTREEKEKWVREAVNLYDLYNKNFPFTTQDFEVQKAMVLLNNQIEVKEEIFNLLEKGFSKAPDKISDANAIYTYFSLYYEKYKAPNTKITVDFLLDKYSFINKSLKDLQASNPDKKNECTIALNSIRALAKDLLTCDYLATYYETHYPSNKENTSWISNALENLAAQCSAKPIFNTLAEKFYSNKPTSAAANFMALGKLKQRNLTEAIHYFTESAERQANPIEKASIYYSLATGLLANDKAKAKEFLNKAMVLNPKMGRCYLFLAQLYANSADECSRNDFEKKAIFYLAMQTAEKAGNIEPALKPASDKLIENFTQNALTPAEIANEKMNGKSITLGCWINETLTFPNK